MMRTQKQLFLNFDLDELDILSDNFKKSAGPLNIQKSCITELIMERKLTKLLNGNQPNAQKAQECFCSDLDYVKLCQLYTNVSQQKDQFSLDNTQLKSKLDAANNVISHLTQEIKSVFATHQAYKDQISQDMSALQKNNLNYITTLQKTEQKIVAQHQNILQLTRSNNEVTGTLEDQRKVNHKLSKKLDNFVFVSKEVGSQSPSNSTRRILSPDCLPRQASPPCKKYSIDNSSVIAKTAYTNNASKGQDSCYKNDFLSSNSSTEHPESQVPHQELKKLTKRNSEQSIDKLLQDESILNANAHDDNTHLSIIYENESSTKVHTLESIFKQSKLRDRILKFLDPSEMIALRSTNKFFNFAMSIDSRVFKGILQHHHTQFKIKIDSLEKKLSLFEGNTANISGDYVQFLLYKYVKLKKSPGHYIQDAFSQGSQLHQLIKNPLMTQALGQKCPEEKPSFAMREKTPGFMDSWFKKSPIVEKIQTGKFMDKLKSINNAIKKSATIDDHDCNKENLAKNVVGSEKVNADDTNNCSYSFIDEPAVKSEISRLEAISKEQDFESIGIKLETDINSIPKELIKERNQFFDKTMEQIKTGSGIFNKLVKELGISFFLQGNKSF